MLVQSNSTVPNTIEKFKTLPFFSHIELKKIGKFALKVISEEYTAVMNEIDNEPFCVYCHLNSQKSGYSLPCRHILHDNPNITFSPNEFHQRYLRNIKVTENKIDSTFECSNNQQFQPKLNNYTNIMARIAPFASVASRNSEIMSVFENTFDQLNAIKKDLNTGMPATIEMKGRISCHPANNVVLGGAPKQKIIHRCSKCHETGHNARSCPNCNK